MGERRSSISVIICTHDAERWDECLEAVASVQRQDRPAAEIVVVVDHNQQLFERIQREVDGVRCIENVRKPGASGARNSGVVASSGELVAFLDDDAVADPHWLDALCSGIAEENVIGVGGQIVPLWATARPTWFPDEFGWVVGASYKGMPFTRSVIRNVWTGNMLVRRSVFEAVGGFREGFGKIGFVSRPEDTEFCLRASHETGGLWLYEPAALVAHRVPAYRATFEFFLRRCIAEGRGKLHLASISEADALRTERSHGLHLIADSASEAAQGVSRGYEGLRRAGVIAVGLGAAIAGFGYEAARVRAARVFGARSAVPSR